MKKVQPIGKCCGVCDQVNCKFEEGLYMPGEHWLSKDNCTKFSCAQKGNQFYISSSQETCPDVSECADHLKYFKGCCQHCKLVPEALSKDYIFFKLLWNN